LSFFSLDFCRGRQQEASIKNISMGIPNFLPDIEKTAGRLVDLREYKGRRVAIDISVWIQRECHANSEMLANEQHLSNFGRAILRDQQIMHEGQHDAAAAQELHETKKEEAVQKYLQKVGSSILDDIVRFRDATESTVLIVFDGATPPIKESTVQSRKRKRDEELDERDRPVDVTGGTPGLERRYRANRRAGAGDHYQQVVDVIIASLRTQQIPFLVAPYEADGQLAYLQLNHYVDLVVTNDSDLIAYGPMCPVLYKVARDEQRNWTRGILIRRSDLGAIVMLPGSKKSSSTLSLLDLSPAMLAVFFVACGGDYCRKLAGIGVKTVATFMREFFLSQTAKQQQHHSSPQKRSGDHHPTDAVVAGDDDEDDECEEEEEEAVELHPLGRLIQRLMAVSWDAKTMSLLDKMQYERDFIAAVFMYRHSLVYDPIRGRCCHLIPLDQPDVELIDYLPYREFVEQQYHHEQWIGKTWPHHHEQWIGKTWPREMATYIAEGWICPKRMALRSTGNHHDDDNATTTTATATTTPMMIPDCVRKALQAYNDSTNNNNDDGQQRQPQPPDDATFMDSVDAATTTAVSMTTDPPQRLEQDAAPPDDDNDADNGARGETAADSSDETQPPGTQLMEAITDNNNNDDNDDQPAAPAAMMETNDAAGNDDDNVNDDDDDNAMETQER
jgi:5'-3' exonuclease